MQSNHKLSAMQTSHGRSTKFESTTSNVSARFECVFIIIFSAHVLLITRLLYDSKMFPGQRAGLQSGCKSKEGMLTNLIIFEECTSKTLLIF